MSSSSCGAFPWAPLCPCTSEASTPDLLVAPRLFVGFVGLWLFLLVILVAIFGLLSYRGVTDGP